MQLRKLNRGGAITVGTASVITIGLAVLGFYAAWITMVSNKADAAITNYTNLQSQILQSQNLLQQEITQTRTDVSWIKEALKAQGFKVPNSNN